MLLLASWAAILRDHRDLADAYLDQLSAHPSSTEWQSASATLDAYGAAIIADLDTIRDYGVSKRMAKVLLAEERGDPVPHELLQAASELHNITAYIVGRLLAEISGWVRRESESRVLREIDKRLPEWREEFSNPATPRK